MAFKGVLTQLASGEGRQEELARALLARGEEEGNAAAVVMGAGATALSLRSLGRDDEAARYHDRMTGFLLAGRDDPDLLSFYPLAATISSSMGDKKSVRKLAGEGLWAMEAFPGLEGERDQLRELRRSADGRFGPKPGKGAAGRRGRWILQKRPGR